MNIYEKLNECRNELQTIELKKSGHNPFLNFKYYELEDFISTINRLNKKHGIISLVSFENNAAVMYIVNTEKPDEKICFYSPLGSAKLKGCHEVQNIGATEKYQRRYLYLTAYEISEHDGLDSSIDDTPIQQTEEEGLLMQIEAYKTNSKLSADQKAFIDTIPGQLDKHPDKVVFLKDMLKRIQDSLNPKKENKELF